MKSSKILCVKGTTIIARFLKHVFLVSTLTPGPTDLEIS